MTLTDNATNSPQNVVLSGTGTTPGVYFSDGFESGDFSNWPLSPASTGQASVQTSVVNSGTYAAAFTNTSGQFVSIATPLIGGSQTQTYTRFYFRFSSGLGTTPIAMGQDTNDNLVWLIYYDASRQGLDIYFWNGARTRFDLYSNANVLSPDTWYSIEVQDNETTSGQGQVRLNGTSIGTVTGDLSVTNAYSELVLYDEAVGTAYFDDVKVASSYNGPTG